MDDYGIYPGLDACFRMLMRAQRGTGRTQRMLERYQPGSVVVFCNLVQAKEAERRAAQMGKTLAYVVSDPVKHDISETLAGRRADRVIFDHTWVERYYEFQIQLVALRLAGMAKAYEKPGIEAAPTPEALLGRERFSSF